ncbi:DUF5050 domain-containing protein [Clostridium kluyveri]|uniref:DUF5050 domain-containing protein n=1 Tax=Clostridium kluyveri TaxID=1534 RepID=UPI0022476639|nr:DUF5050 domain-containing protein [Clostridium kluyveri]UZQ49140.1 DUF5050 domain-containing protein [Clostridium kluyveri]
MSFSGNTNGNIYFNGISAKQDEWIYYTDGGTCLYKCKEDGNTITKLFDTLQGESSIEYVYNINAVGDWVYYSTSTGIYKIKTDGSSKTKIFDHSCNTMIVIGDIIYFTATFVDEVANRSFFKMNTDGSGITLINPSEFIQNLNILGDWAYYVNCSDNNRIYKIKLDGSSKTKIKDECVSQMLIDNGYMYYSSPGAIYKTKLNSSESLCILNDSNVDGNFNVANGWIYYTSKDCGLYKIKTDGSSNVKIIDGNILNPGISGNRKIYGPNVVDDWVYYTWSVFTPGEDIVEYVYKTKIDGSENDYVDSSINNTNSN